MARITVGATVQYARAFLRNTGNIAGGLPSMRGVVLSVRPLATPNRQVVRVAWGDGTESSALNTNLSVVGKPELE